MSLKTCIKPKDRAITINGQIIQLSAITMNFEKSTSALTARPIPTTPPTIACEVEVGILKKVAKVTKKPDQISAMITAR